MQQRSRRSAGRGRWRRSADGDPVHASARLAAARTAGLRDRGYPWVPRQAGGAAWADRDGSWRRGRPGRRFWCIWATTSTRGRTVPGSWRCCQPGRRFRASRWSICWAIMSACCWMRLDGDRAAATDWLWAGGKEALASWGLPPDLPREAWEAALPAAHVAWLRGLPLTHREGRLFVRPCGYPAGCSGGRTVA